MSRYRKKAIEQRNSQTGDHVGRDLSDMERKQSKGHSLPEDHRGRDLSGQKESNRVKGTHKLETTEGGTCQDMERKQLSEEHSLQVPGDHRGRDLSGHRKRVTKRGVPTS